MIECVLSADCDGNYSQELYSAFCDGFPIENLQPLLASSSPEAQATAAYLAYELGWLTTLEVEELLDVVTNAPPETRYHAYLKRQGDKLQWYPINELSPLVT